MNLRLQLVRRRDHVDSCGQPNVSAEAFDTNFAPIVCLVKNKQNVEAFLGTGNGADSPDEQL
jgi:hypothetical protein